MPELNVRIGSVPGYAHSRKLINNQDASVASSVTIGDSTYHFGAVFDGCTGGRGKQSKTEVGATLLAAFFRSEIPMILAAHTALSDVPGILYQRSIGYFGSIARSTVMGAPDTLWQFVQNHLLCTILGYIADEEQLLFFSAGDGVLVVNDTVTIINQDNKPLYLAYHLLDSRSIGKVQLPTSFVTTAFPRKDVSRFAVSTDGLANVATENGEHLHGVWNYEPGAKAGLQWHLNKCSSERHLFEDDCTVIASWNHPTQERAP